MENVIKLCYIQRVLIVAILGQFKYGKCRKNTLYTWVVQYSWPVHVSQRYDETWSMSLLPCQIKSLPPNQSHKPPATTHHGGHVKKPNNRGTCGLSSSTSWHLWTSKCQKQYMTVLSTQTTLIFVPNYKQLILTVQKMCQIEIIQGW